MLVDSLFQVQHNETTRHGESICVNLECQIRFLVEQYGLKDIAVNDGGVQIAITGDGAALTTSSRKAGQTCLGIKMVDRRCLDPMTKQPCFAVTEETEINVEVAAYQNVQSVNHCFPSAIVSAPESRHLVTEHFRDFFIFFNGLRTIGLPANGNEPAFKPFEIICPADMSFQQKITGLGGPCKVMKHFCICCESNSLKNFDLFYKTDDVDELCHFCKANEVSTCCHRAVNDEAELTRKQDWLVKTLVQDIRHRARDQSLTFQQCLPEGEHKCLVGYKKKGRQRSPVYETFNLRETIDAEGNCSLHISNYLEHMYHTVELGGGSAVVYDPCAADKEVNMANIDYVVGDDRSKNRVFRTNLMRELSHLQPSVAIDRNTPIETLRGIVRPLLLLRYKISRYKAALHCHHVSVINRAVASPGDTATCILHFHQRTIEKIVSILLKAGLSECKNPDEVDTFLTRINRVVNRDIFGRHNRHEEDTTGWSVPMMPDGKTLGDITMDDSTCKMFDRGMEHLIDACIANHTFGPRYASDWRECMTGYRQVRALLNARTEFEFDDVCAFVLVSDSFMERYIALTGRDGMTNYFHMLHAGHIAYYLLKFKNLYRLSQQGWENINSVMKRSFHRGTQRGGGKKSSAKIKPVFYRVLRAALWRMGQMFGFLQHFGWVPNDKFEYGSTQQMPKFDNVQMENVDAYAATVLKFGDVDFIDELIDGIDDDNDYNILEEALV
jgi:hypothetical protein